MTPARKAALQWFHDRGPAVGFVISVAPDAPTWLIIKRMIADGQIDRIDRGDAWANRYSLTDKGRRDLHEAGR